MGGHVNTGRVSGRSQGLASVPAKLRFIASIALTTCALAVSYAACCGAALGDNAQAIKELEAKLDTPGAIMLRDASLADWLFAIQDLWKVDIVFGNELQTETVNGGFGKTTTLREILNAILTSRNYGYEPVGGSLVIKSLDQMGNLNPQFKGELIRYEHLSPTEAEENVRIFG